MRANHQPEPLEVVRSEAGPGRVGLRLIGELDLHTVSVLEAELSRTRERSAPSVIDLSELRFLDLTGLRALLRAVDDVAGTTRLIGATGIVRRLIELAHTIETDAGGAFTQLPHPAEPTTRISAGETDAPAARGHQPVQSRSAFGVAASCMNHDRKAL